MKRQLIIAATALALLGIGYGFGQQAKATVSINNDIAWFRLDGSRLSQTAPKRLAFVSLHYNDATVPCILVDTVAGGQLSNDNVGGASISCGWTPEAIATIGGK